LWAADGSLHALKAAEVAARLAREAREAEVMIINVGHIPPIAFAGAANGAIELGALWTALQESGQQILGDTAKKFTGVNLEVSCVYREGEPATEILKAAQEQKADFIIMGSRGLGQIGGLILGSVSERVLHGAHTPVLIVR
jgi:nucleotide-binding universal stress UspA family protein